MNITERIARLIRPEIRATRAYSVADAGGRIKLDAMESPYPLPAEIKRLWLDRLREVELNRYPDVDARALKQSLRAAMAVPAGMEVLLGNGSDELIQIVLQAVARPGAHVLAPMPTFVMYEVIANAVGMGFVGVALTEDFDLDVAAMRSAMQRYQPLVTFIAYPNNPTGNLFSADAVERLIGDAAGLVVIDEAYFAFTDSSFMDRLHRYDNLLVLRTLSKMGLAGLRLGLLVGPPAWIEEFNKVRLPYNINSLTQASAQFVLGRRELIAEQVQQIRSARQRLLLALGDLPGIRAWPSETNFILFRTQSRTAKDVYDGLYAAGVLVKNLDPAGGALRGCLRVTVGTPAENEAFINALRRVLRA
jgi:histidinol-phosphate aminotransferase